MLLRARFAILAIAAFLPFGLPHMHRQSDTLGVSMRYWSRWTVEAASHHPLLPATLVSGDQEGILPTEFPLLNLVTAPCFALGTWTGRYAARLLLLAAVLALTLYNARAWRGRFVDGVDAGRAMLAVPLVSFAMPVVGRFMPDYLAMILVCLAVGLSWDGKRPSAALALAALGLLVKPTAVTALGLCLFRPRAAWRASWWIPGALAMAGLYYTVGTHAIEALKSVDPALGYAVAPRPPLASLVAFFSSPRELIDLLMKESFFPFGLPIVALFYFLRAWRGTSPPGARLWLLLVAQLAAGACLGGVGTFKHSYYFIGMAPTAALLLVGAWDVAPGAAARAVLGLLFVAKLLDVSWNDVNVFTPPSSKEANWRLERDCRDLAGKHPELPWRQGYVFRTELESYPLLALCFGERTSSRTAEWGFLLPTEALPGDCTVYDRRERVAIVRCARR